MTYLNKYDKILKTLKKEVRGKHGATGVTPKFIPRVLAQGRFFSFTTVFDGVTELTEEVRK